eukprot:gb/GFBE01018515.1/.p1 GENE.gb/GFBE01018515.1/~~gb/GFBE01018515.1/.p1  ORF type:complete len:225 (+),score=50.34 gb/GFBE01018515.1/:1-675(+)
MYMSFEPQVMQDRFGSAHAWLDAEPAYIQLGRGFEPEPSYHANQMSSPPLSPSTFSNTYRSLKVQPKVQTLDVDSEDSQSTQDGAERWQPDTDTVTVKNIPCRSSAKELLDYLESLGFGEDTLTYFHLPLKAGQGAKGKTAFNLGYCFVGFRSPHLARAFYESAKDLCLPSRQSSKVLQVEPSRCQFRSLCDRKSMHGEVMLFEEQQRVSTGAGALENGVWLSL